MQKENVDIVSEKVYTARSDKVSESDGCETGLSGSERSPLGDVSVACKEATEKGILGNETEKRNFDVLQSAAGVVISGVRKQC